jgi:hypothetical protein
MGAHPFAGDYRSRAALVASTFAKLAQVLRQGVQLHVEHLIVRDNQASIGLHALVAAKNGMWFDNHYRWIVCFKGDEIVGARSYPDSVMTARSAKPNDLERHIYLRSPMCSAAPPTRELASTASGSMRCSADVGHRRSTR